MPDKKLTDTKTYNPCDDCPHSFSKNNQESNVCKICEFKYFLDEINRQNAEIERLQERCIEIQRCDKELIETLNKIHEEKIKTAKAEAYKECIEKVKKLWGMYRGYDFEIKLDNLLTELVGEDK